MGFLTWTRSKLAAIRPFNYELERTRAGSFGEGTVVSKLEVKCLA
jgi:hypothetical protein